MKLLFSVILMACMVVSANADRFVISDGNEAKAAIVIPKDATEPMRTGASELQTHIEMIGGAKLPIIEVSNVFNPVVSRDYKGIIVISNFEIDPQTKQKISFKSEEFTIKTVAGSPYQIRISGDGKRGALYGCYTFLEDVLGFRWYTPTITKVPKGKTVSVKNLWIHQKPDFEYREPFFDEAFDKMWAVRNKTNGNSQHLDDSVGGKIAYGRFVHTFSELVPQSYFAEHPEYFSLIEGKRMEGYAQLCLTNPDVLKIAINTVRGWLQNDTKSIIFSVSQNDTGFPCECDNCKAVVAEEGSQSGPILRFVNAIADDIAKDYPNVLIDTLAYSYSEAPPKHVKPHKNVRVRMAPITNCFGHKMGTCDRNKIPYDNLVAWSKITDQLYIWHYSTNFAHYLMPLPSIDEIRTSIPIYKKYGAVGLFYQGSYQSPGGALAELKSYLCAKLMWNASRNSGEVLNDYLNGVYGKGASAMGQWINLIHSEVRKSKKNHAFIYDGPVNPYMTDAVIAKSYVLFDKAAKAAADNPVALREIDKARMWMQYVSLTKTDTKYVIDGNEYKATGQTVDQNLKDSFAKNLKEFGVRNISEGNSDIDGFLKSLGNANKFKAYTLESDNLKVNIVPEIGGRIVGIIIKKNNTNILKEASGAMNLASGGYEEYFSHDYRGPGYSDSYTVDTSKTTKDSVAMELGRFSPIMVSRVISLNGNKVTVSTTATNTGSEKYTLKMRVHPEFNIPDKVKPYGEFVSVSGEAIKSPFKDAEENKFFGSTNLPNGKWTVDLGDYTVTNTFDTNMVSQVLLNSTLTNKRFNLELYSTSVNLNPGETATFTNSYEIGIK